ncbi:MAG: [Fe-Fe] hydrogenase large subunit C-terminal domain-containing protein [Clostridiales bacterium]|nr:[Fe-Fe] hydrogenase large subunit C-terminal domain-containing protein [Clostridiales bacterium]
MTYFHSVILDRDKCHGCTNCISHCPTEAIRVKNGKAKIIKERCIDCGECIKVCQAHAKKAAADSFDMLNQFDYNIALPAPSFYGQFRNDLSVNKILTAFIKIGFDDVFEVARGAEYISAATRRLLMEGNLKKPVISSACPAVLRLIRERFPNLLPNILPLVSPMEAAAMLARKQAHEKTGIPDERIGVFFITPCPAKVTSIKVPLTLEKSNVSGAIAAKDAFGRIRPIVETVEEQPLGVSGREGISWARSGGECKGTGVEDYMAVDGIHNVITVLEEIEYGKVNTVEFIELSACTSGCSGGALNITNPFLAARRTTQQSKKTELKEPENLNVDSLAWQKTVTGKPTAMLDDDLEEAMRKMEQMDEIFERLPKIDCGSCGAPTCKALAEDIVRGFGSETDCIFRMRERIGELARELYEMKKRNGKE